MVSLKGKSKGFTIVELLIVIVVIAILATLVIVTFTGIQQKARDSQRQTDINAVDSHLEAFYAQNGYYPTITDLGSSTFLSANMKGLDTEALVDPKGGSIQTGASDAQHYGYATTGCTTTSGSGTTNQCASFVLTATLEANGNTYTKQSN